MEKADGAIWTESFGFGKMGEDGVSSFASRMTQGILVGHHERTGAVLHTSMNELCEGKLDETDTE